MIFAINHCTKKNSFVFSGNYQFASSKMISLNEIFNQISKFNMTLPIIFLQGL